MVQLNDSRSGDSSIFIARSCWTLRVVPRGCWATLDRTQTARPTAHDRRRTRTQVHRTILRIKTVMGFHVAEIFYSDEVGACRLGIEAQSTKQPQPLYLRQYHSFQGLSGYPA